MSSKNNKRTCPQGHQYFKSSDCPVCPICEQERKPESGFLSMISAPARRALESKNIVSLEILATYSEKELLQLHGLGPSAIPKLKKALEEKGMMLKD